MPKLEETLGVYEMSVVPRVLCTVEDYLYANIQKAIEKAKDSPLQSAHSPDLLPIIHRILIIYAMPVLPGLKKSLSGYFIKLNELMVVGYHVGRVVFDHFSRQVYEESDTTEENSDVQSI